MRKPRMQERRGQARGAVRSNAPLTAVIIPGACYFTTEELRVIHRMLYDVGWWYSWGETARKSIGEKLDAEFRDDDEHLRRK